MPYKDPAKERERSKRRYREDPEYRARIAAANKRYRETNPGKVREWQRRYADADPERRREQKRRYLERNPAKNREAHLRRKHGLRPEDVGEMWELQGSKCYLCQEPLDLAEVHIDHDHRCCPENTSCRTCRRGLAHDGCNVSIGHSGDSPERLRRWADNLEAAQRAVTERLADRHEQLMLELG